MGRKGLMSRTHCCRCILPPQYVVTQAQIRVLTSFEDPALGVLQYGQCRRHLFGILMEHAASYTAS